MDEEMMCQAILEAQKALSKNEVPIGAVVTCGGRIIARAHNMIQTLTDPTAHAEMQAITCATEAVGGKYLSECSIYVTVEPCPMCAAALAWAQIGAIIYGASDAKKGYSTISDALVHPKTRVVKGVLESRCAELITTFFQKKR